MIAEPVPIRPSRRRWPRLGGHANPATWPRPRPPRVLANLAQVPLTVAGFACVDAGVFIASHVAGWIVTGLSLVLVEHIIADED